MSELKFLMQREYQNDFDALRAAEVGMQEGADLVCINAIDPMNLQFGAHRVYWRVSGGDHYDQIDNAIQKELYPDEDE